ncbi:hypothetical protein [Micromonospora tarensis]|uniref:Uncharacterized protein n=1 Tax=Micromonospora tarensis TaxID=2806100 RepID=A0ABS1YD75_9ACTN|nr:hypothetical protein [Micromonospora tarensis]MBM0275307.1 hypothetical protein [Micromonospora tarensis]
MTIDNAAALLDFAERHRTAVLIGGGLVVGVLLVLARVCRHQKGRSAALTFAAAAVALGFSAEGMWEVATKALHLGPEMAILLFAFAEILMLSEAGQARKKISEERSPTRHIRAVWVIAIVAGLAAASHADNLSGQVIRAFMPMAVAWQWSSRILDDLPETVREESRWIWTPRRIGIHLGLLKPGAVDDLAEVFRQRRITALVNAGVKLYAEQQAAKLHAGTKPDGRSWWPRRDRLAVATAKLQRLAKTADKADIAAARAQLRLTFSIEQQLFRRDDLDERGRQTLDDVRLIMRDATERVRAVQPPASLVDQIRSNDLVQMRPEIADQIWTRAVDQHWSSGRTNGADQSRTNPSAVDQPPASKSVPATRATAERRTTARVDRDKPVSPAPGADVPPKVREMAKALAKKYRGEIPARAEVMRVMGWTSADYAGKAINLVRAERAANTTKES